VLRYTLVAVRKAPTEVVPLPSFFQSHGIAVGELLAEYVSLLTKLLMLLVKARV
jgi:hypothetical protein